MTASNVDRLFAGSIPQLYNDYLVPMIFEPYAADLAARVSLLRPSRVLEIAAGTGVVTRHLAQALDPAASIIATDLNQSMLDQAIAVGTARPVEWRQADAMQLPFPDAGFDVVVCQFGAMFFPDKPGAFAEARRVLRPGGTFIFNVWDRIDENEFALAVTRVLERLFPADPPRFMARIPHGYHDQQVIAGHLAEGGFTHTPVMTSLAARSHAPSPDIVATAYCQGTPLRNEIEARDRSRLIEATDAATAAIAHQFGHGKMEGKIQAHIFATER
ncbi:MAG: methyltransferase domain-containing protein [Burkholderiaceae bacterium]